MSQNVPEVSLTLLHAILCEIPMLTICYVWEDLGTPDSLDIFLSVSSKLVTVDLSRSGSSSEAEVVQCLSEVARCDLERWNKTHSSAVQACPQVEVDLTHLSSGSRTTANKNRSNFIETDSGPSVAS